MKIYITYKISILLFCLFSSSAFAELSIQQIKVDQTKHQIKLQCKFDNLVDSLITENSINYSIYSFTKKGDTSELVILSAIKQNEGKITLTAQAALRDAIYNSEKRIFSIQYRNGNLNVGAERSAVLGSFQQLLDLRPYTFTDTYKTSKRSLLLCLLLLCLLMASIPVHYKFFFKKNNIKKYKSIKDQFSEDHIDPYTYETFQDEHEVVLIDDKILLLETWKTLSENEEVKNNPDYAYLFHKKEEGHFFKPTSTLYQYLHNAWFGCLSTAIALILCHLLQHFQFDLLTHLLENIFDGALQISTVLYTQIITGACFGFCFYTITTLSVLPWKIFENTWIRLLKNIFIGTIFCTLIFFEAALLSIYVSLNHFLNSLVVWLFVGLNIGILTAYLTQNNWKNGLQRGLFAGISSVIIHCIFNQLIQLEFLNTQMACFLSLSLFATIIIAGTYQVKQVVPNTSEVPVAKPASLSNQTVTNKI